MFCAAASKLLNALLFSQLLWLTVWQLFCHCFGFVTKWLDEQELSIYRDADVIVGQLSCSSPVDY